MQLKVEAYAASIPITEMHKRSCSQESTLPKSERISRRGKGMDKIKIGIVGYGNIGKAVELAIRQNADMTPAVILTRRPPQSIRPQSSGRQVDLIDRAHKYADIVDVAILCGGSALDLPQQGPMMAAIFNTVDSYDTHARIPDYFNELDRISRQSGRQRSSPPDGIPGSSLSFVSSKNQFCRSVPIIPSGVLGSAKAIPMPSAN